MTANIPRPGDLLDVEGRTVMITGASSGVGAFLAERLAERGANLVLAARRKDRLEEVAARIGDESRVHVVTCDVVDPEQVASAVASGAERFGRIDVLVNCAGVMDWGPVAEKIPSEMFDNAIQVNLFGTFYACREVGALMLADGKGGSIINIASIAGLGGYEFLGVGYQTAKAAVLQLTRALALQWGDRGVRVNALALGFFPTEMTEEVLKVPMWVQRFENQAPMNRWGRLEELVAPLLFLATDASSYVTGHTLAIDGGTSASIGAPDYGAEELAFQASLVPGLGERIVPPTR
jgi:gluconate 5-dehydrogenase